MRGLVARTQIFVHRRGKKEPQAKAYNLVSEGQSWLFPIQYNTFLQNSLYIEKRFHILSI